MDLYVLLQINSLIYFYVGSLRLKFFIDLYIYIKIYIFICLRRCICAEKREIVEEITKIEGRLRTLLPQIENIPCS